MRAVWGATTGSITGSRCARKKFSLEFGLCAGARAHSLCHCRGSRGELTTFGRKALSATLQDADGHVLERLPARTDDWNIAMSRRLPAGAYSLVLEKCGWRQEIEFRRWLRSGAVRGKIPQRATRAWLKCALPCPSLRPRKLLTLDKAVRFTASGVRQFPLPPAEAGGL